MSTEYSGRLRPHAHPEATGNKEAVPVTTRLKGELGTSTVTAGDFNTPLSAIDKITEQEIPLAILSPLYFP